MATRLHHPYHSHDLILRELSQNCGVCCFLCGLDLRGATYCCLDCDIYLHESCLELPLQIKHPSHSEHPLTLSRGCHSYLYGCNGCSNRSGEIFIYCCDECMFTLDIACAVSTLPPPEGHREEEMIQHFSHDHRLTFFNVDRAIKITCKACRQPILGPTYGCGLCFFLLHESCTQLPRKIQKHPFHNDGHDLILLADKKEDFPCKACAKTWQFAPTKVDYHQFVYHCDGCKLNLGVRCAISTLPLLDQQMEDPMMFQHFSHCHQLTYFCFEMDSDIHCSVCDLNVSGDVYGCLECIFFLHKSCTELPQELVHSLHCHPLHLEPKPQHASGPQPESPARTLGLIKVGESLCRCCNRKPYGFIYSCHDCPFNLDLECAEKTLVAIKKGLSAEIHHSLHPDPLALRNFVGPGIVLCNACQRSVQGLAYSSNAFMHSFHLHVSCAGLPLILEHPCHPKHPIKLLPMASKESFTCGGCNRESKGCAFFCAECQFYLDMDCASQKPSLKHQLHEHSLTYFQRAKYLQCSHCGYACNRDLYRCVECNFNLHHDCVPLPLSGKHELHGHPLFLCDRVINEFFTEQYCDLCEEPRKPDHGVYYCKECNCAAHIYCVYPKVESKGKKEDQNPLLDKLDEEITRVEADVEEMKRKLEALKRKRAKISSLSLTFKEAGRAVHQEMEFPVYPSDKTFDLLLKMQGRHEPCSLPCSGGSVTTRKFSNYSYKGHH